MIAYELDRGGKAVDLDTIDLDGLVAVDIVFNPYVLNAYVGLRYRQADATWQRRFHVDNIADFEKMAEWASPLMTRVIA